jgi:hypothetical protein
MSASQDCLVRVALPVYGAGALVGIFGQPGHPLINMLEDQGSLAVRDGILSL